MSLLQSIAGTETHFVLEACAYALGARTYWITSRGHPIPTGANRIFLLGAVIFGALLGSKTLHVLEHLDYLISQGDYSHWLSGKSVLGGLLGGTLAAELAKRAIGWHIPTGDPWVPALVVGLVVGRIGCQVSGTWDQTYGIPTTLPWAWDYGDGIGRHPTALYEILLVGLAYLAIRATRLNSYQGASFAGFMLAYCLIRIGLEFLKPPFGPDAIGGLPVSVYLGLTAIQWAGIAGCVWYTALLHVRTWKGIR